MTAASPEHPNPLAESDAAPDAARFALAQWLAAWERRDFAAMAAWTQPSWTECGHETARELAHAYARRWLLAARIDHVDVDDPFCAWAQCSLVVGCATQPPVAIDMPLQLTYEAGRWGVRPL